MTIQEVKNYLSQAYYIDKRICALQDEITTLQSRLERCTASYTMLSGGSAQPTFEYTLDRVMKYREMLNAEVDSLIDKKKDIKKTFELLHDDRQKLVLYKRYINFQTIESIAEDLDITPRQVYKIYKKSLEKLQKFIEVQY